ncbi:hypothetical protein GKE82_24030 [Conexibacter sp. W3-3-2]|uniref:hypothetical protein n=1 Tax=Conexibacter sp. W3-3-2 TaxID=2675227 RepID=UPI0012B70972|nr:hypothetical protein [Conexibacter sp. W3-3-2]MTD47277.1 hypothetical protein [Conexibacter sp. W3-3-2]
MTSTHTGRERIDHLAHALIDLRGDRGPRAIRTVEDALEHGFSIHNIATLTGDRALAEHAARARRVKESHQDPPHPLTTRTRRARPGPPSARAARPWEICVAGAVPAGG